MRPARKYLIRATYDCSNAQSLTGIGESGKWFVVSFNKRPQVGDVGIDFLDGYVCPNHSFQDCQDAADCMKTKILEVREYKIKEAKRLNAKESKLVGSLLNK